MAPHRIFYIFSNPHVLTFKKTNNNLKISVKVDSVSQGQTRNSFSNNFSFCYETCGWCFSTFSREFNRASYFKSSPSEVNLPKVNQQSWNAREIRWVTLRSANTLTHDVALECMHQKSLQQRLSSIRKLPQYFRRLKNARLIFIPPQFGRLPNAFGARSTLSMYNRRERIRQS